MSILKVWFIRKLAGRGMSKKFGILCLCRNSKNSFFEMSLCPYSKYGLFENWQVGGCQKNLEFCAFVGIQKIVSSKCLYVHTQSMVYSKIGGYGDVKKIWNFVLLSEFK